MTKAKNKVGEVFKSQSDKTAYTTEIIHDVPAAQVAAIVANRMSKPKYRSHVLLPEDDGEFTLIFVFDA
jgi:hypothetical protein